MNRGGISQGEYIMETHATGASPFGGTPGVTIWAKKLETDAWSHEDQTTTG